MRWKSKRGLSREIEREKEVLVEIGLKLKQRREGLEAMSLKISGTKHCCVAFSLVTNQPQVAFLVSGFGMGKAEE